MRPLPDLTTADLRVVSRWLDDDGSLRILREPSSTDLIAVIRAGVESGTIKGEVVEAFIRQGGQGTDVIPPLRQGRYLVIPVSDGGSET